MTVHGPLEPAGCEKCCCYDQCGAHSGLQSVWVCMHVHARMYAYLIWFISLSIDAATMMLVVGKKHANWLYSHISLLKSQGQAIQLYMQIMTFWSFLYSTAVIQQTSNFTLYMRFSSVLSNILGIQSTQRALQNIENIVCVCIIVIPN